MNPEPALISGNTVQEALRVTREASRCLPACPMATIDAVLNDLADRLVAAAPEMLTANRLDLARMDQNDPKYDRLLLDLIA